MTDPFETLARTLDVGPATKAADPTRPQRMNANAFCVRNKVFAMRMGDDMVLKLPPKRVAELIAARVAVPHMVGGPPEQPLGRRMSHLATPNRSDGRRMSESFGWLRDSNPRQPETVTR